MSSSLLSRVKSFAAAKPTQASKDAFIAGADQPQTPAAQAAPSPAASGAVPSNVLVHDPKAAPRFTFNLRLNEYQLELIRLGAEREGASMQKVAKGELVPAIAARARKLGII